MSLHQVKQKLRTHFLRERIIRFHLCLSKSPLQLVLPFRLLLLPGNFFAFDLVLDRGWFKATSRHVVQYNAKAGSTDQ